jgi:hypothetical protein
MPEATSAAILSADGVWLTDLARAKFAHQPLLSSLILRVLTCDDQKDRSGDGRIACHPNIDCADDSFGIGTTVFLNTSTVAPLSPLSCPARLHGGAAVLSLPAPQWVPGRKGVQRPRAFV